MNTDLTQENRENAEGEGKIMRGKIIGRIAELRFEISRPEGRHEFHELAQIGGQEVNRNPESFRGAERKEHREQGIQPQREDTNFTNFTNWARRS